jgi:hypothetical protein
MSSEHGLEEAYGMLKASVERREPRSDRVGKELAVEEDRGGGDGHDGEDSWPAACKCMISSVS